MSSTARDGQRSTEAMVDYDRHSSPQQSMVVTLEARIRDLVDRIGRADPEMRIVDYGCGPGMSAINSVRPAVDAYRAGFPDDQIAVCHADQPANDWNALFGLVYGPSGYQTGDGRVRTEAAVGSFYDQMVAPDSVNLATSFAASHWLSSAVTLDAPGTVWFADLTGAARREMADRAQRDWTRFLTVRSRELRPGGFLLVSTLGSVPDPDEVNGTAASGRGTYRAMQIVAQTMADDGLLDHQVLDGFLFPLWFPTEEEARAPLLEDEHLSSAFDIETVESTAAAEKPSDIFADLISDPVAYADAYKGYVRAFADSSLRTQLFGPSAGNAEQENELAGEFFDRLHEFYRSGPGEYAFELWHLTVVLRRRPQPD